MKPRFRLTRSKDFERVRRFGKSYAHPLLVLIVHPTKTDQVRIGIAAGKSVGGAVQRNRAKRLLRAAAAPLIRSVAPGHDLILLARRPLVEVKSQDAQTALETLLKRAKLTVNEHAR